MIKFKTLFESPSNKNKEANGGSFAARSARAAFLGRSITKTSDDLKNLPLFDEGTRNGKLRKENTLKHNRYGSHFDATLVPDSELVGIPRRKTVGFKKDSKGLNSSLRENYS